MVPNTTQTIARAVDDARDEMVQFLQRLVQTPSLPDQEGAAQEILANKLKAMGLEVEIVPTHYDDLLNHPAFGDDGFSPNKRINVVARWKGTQTGEGKSLIINGHVDVVPAGDEAIWTDSPWSGTIRDGYLYGRGSCDMKAGLCAGIYAVQTLQRLGYRPAKDVLIECVIGEESGGVGALTTIVKGYRADAAILLEPTSLSICPVAAGALTFRLTVPGRAAHAAMKAEGVSAIEKFALLLNAINELQVERHRNYHHPLFKDPANIAPISIGTIRGGKWHSTVPEEVVAEGRLGVLPGESNEAARKALQDALLRASAQDEWLKDHTPTLEWFEGQFESAETPQSDPLVQTLIEAHKKLTGKNAEIYGVTYGSDMRLYTNHAGIAATHYGPGDVSVAHGANEHVSLDEFITAAKVVGQLITDWCGGQFE